MLLEKTSRIGIKILISGGGKCNITHDGLVEDLLRAFRPNEARFLRPSCYRFTNRDIVDMLCKRCLRVYTRPDGRIFPVDATAKDVVAILAGYLDAAGVEVRLKSPVTDMAFDGAGVAGASASGEIVRAKAFVVTVGGSSYPGTGTTGDGWAWARKAGHSIVRIMPALAPVITVPEPTGLAGVSARDCVLKARQGGKEFARWRGDVLFTHHGLSGPSVLGISRAVAERLAACKVSLEIDTAPEATFEALQSELADWLRANPKKLVKSFVEAKLPQALATAILAPTGIGPDTKPSNLPAKQRNRLIETMKGWQIGDVKAVPLEKGEVVAGGVALSEVDPHTMRSLRAKGLYFAGEILDVAGPVGGYNLQAAFSTGYVAGEEAAKSALANEV